MVGSMKNTIRNTSGFTLVEMMVALVVSMILVIGIYSSYRLQQRTQASQDQVVEMQQNILAAQTWLLRDIRKAGFDKDLNTLNSSCNVDGSGAAVVPGIHTATATVLGFSMDLDSSGACNGSGENLTYNLYVAADGIQKLSRQNPAPNEAVAEYFEAIEFFYTLADGTQTTTPARIRFSEIRSVQISLLARTRNRSPGFDNSALTYPPASYQAPAALDPKWGPFVDGRRRQMVITNITFRNMGI
jgi:type IV pilus assembly protein PilW